MQNCTKQVELYQQVHGLMNKPKYLFTHGTGLPDELCIERFKDTDVIVITRDGRRWQRGVEIKEEK